MIGAMMYGVPSSMHGQTTSKYGNDSGKILELNRLCCIDDTPTNTESYFLGSSMRWLKKNTDYQVIVSYADPEYGHSGIIYKGEFKNGKKDGYGEIKWADGDTYKGQFKNGTCEGAGKLIDSDTTYYIGDFINCKRHGYGKQLFINDTTYWGLWVNDEFELPKIDVFEPI